jgi:hypothetical protein
MKRSPQDLEKLIHQTLRSTPEFRAPSSLESRVMAAIEARATLPWWKQSFVRWPMAARIAFVLVSAGLAKVAVMAAVWIMAGFDTAQFTAAFAQPIALFETASAIVDSITSVCGAIYRGIPPLWLYGGLAFIGVMYAALFGIGAAAYRTLFVQR